MSRDLESQGEFHHTIKRRFAFNKLEFQNDSYTGINLNLKYLLRVEMTYQAAIMKSSMVEEHPIIIKNFDKKDAAGKI